MKTSKLLSCNCHVCSDPSSAVRVPTPFPPIISSSFLSTSPPWPHHLKLNPPILTLFGVFQHLIFWFTYFVYYLVHSDVSVMVAEGLVLLFTALSQAPKTVTDRCPTFNQFSVSKRIFSRGRTLETKAENKTLL